VTLGSYVQGRYLSPDVPFAAFALTLYGSLTLLFFSLLRLASRLSHADPRAKRLAQVACGLMILFPPLTLPGIRLLLKLNRHFDAYCREVAEREPD
jgi:hypothetical protein